MRSVIIAIISAVIAIAGRSAFSELYIARSMGVDYGKALPYEICLTVAFVVLCTQFGAWYASAIYTALYALYAFAFRRQFKELFGKARGLFRS